MVIKFQEQAAAPDHFRNVERTLKIGMVEPDIVPDIRIGLQLFENILGGLEDLRSPASVQRRDSCVQKAADAVGSVRQGMGGGSVSC